MKKVFLTLLVLVSVISAGFAATSKSPLDVSFNKPFEPNIYASADFNYYGIGFSGAFELPLFTIEIPQFPMDVGVGVWGDVGYSAWSYIYNGAYWAISPVATLHKSFDFGKDLHFDLFVGAGLSIYGSPWDYAGANFGFASINGFAWELSKDFWLYAQGGYNGGFGTGGLGIRLTL